ncbi:MAG: T9SS type A sorting domain-containing protein [Bacteroidota bacterium]|nr:T9SS type A sorting domain-containing protein [Bacteroidota bacterium]
MKLLKYTALIAIASMLNLVGNLNAQTVQAGIFNPSTNIIEVKGKPDAVLNNTSWALIVTVRWETSYGITLGTVTSALGVAKQGVVGTQGIYSYQKFGTVSIASGLNWIINSENSLFTVPVEGGTGTGTFEVINDTWTGLNNGDFYFESNSADVTAYGNEFYQASVSGVGLDTGLPVELTSFTAIAKGRAVELAWKTATEKNSSNFEIERNNGKEWTKVSSIGASGNSNAPKEYSYVDKLKSAASGSISYRLKMIDNDGKFEYSTVAEVKIIPTVYALEQNYPNPFNPETKIQYSLPADARVTLKVYDIVGREVATIVNEQQTAGYYEQKFGGYNFSSGVYFYRIVAESGGKAAFTSLKKMVMIK